MTSPPTSSNSVSRAPSEPRAKEVDFGKEYHYVVHDLKKIAVFAAGLFVLLIVMALLFTFVL